MGEDGMKKLDELDAECCESEQQQLFAFSARQSYVKEEWIKADPEFWKPKPFVPLLLEQATDPGRMRPDFQRDSTARHPTKDFLQPFPSRTHLLLLLYPACFIQHADN